MKSEASGPSISRFRHSRAPRQARATGPRHEWSQLVTCPVAADTIPTTSQPDAQSRKDTE